jgi:cytosine/adenosine deaminase-related metal-dependent hydrolase
MSCFFCFSIAAKIGILTFEKIYSMRIIQASYIIPLNAAPIKNGFLFIEDDGTVIHLTDIAPISHDFEVEVYDGIVCPGFVNTHCHLELSNMKDLMPEATGLPEFVSQIPTRRNECILDSVASIISGDKEMIAAGIVAVGDISNTTDTLEVKKLSVIKYHSFVEIFGLDKNQATTLLADGLKVVGDYQRAELSASLVPHAPYSLSPALLEGIYFNSKDQLLSIHHQETPSENEMFLESKGDLAELIRGKGLDISSQMGFGENSSHYSLLPYLPKEQKVLLVHNTCSEASDIEQIESHFENAYWCTCPKANWYIERALPDYDLWLEKNLKITVGTDSLASNDTLSILEEIKLIQTNFPHISTETLLEWACKNGAAFFGYSKLGSFTAGNKPGIILIENIDGMMLTENSKVKVLV